MIEDYQRQHEETQRDVRRHDIKTVAEQIRHHVGVTVDGARLDGGEAAELAQLVQRVTYIEPPTESAGRRWNLAALDGKEQKRLENLIEKGAGVKVFRQRRDAAIEESKRSKAQEAARLASRPRQPKLTEPGVVELPAHLFEWLRASPDQIGFDATDLAVLTLMLVQIAAGESLMLSGRVDDDVLTFRTDYGIGMNVDPDRVLSERLKARLDYLGDSGLLKIEKGAEYRVSRGPSLDPAKGEAITKKHAA